eukprot:CFRG1191T1
MSNVITKRMPSVWALTFAVTLVLSCIALVCTADTSPSNNNGNTFNYKEKEIDAIASLHKQIDADNDGVVNLHESEGFLHSLVTNDRERKKKDKAFHKFDSDADDDDFVSVGELQAAWLLSEVRSWSVQDTVAWVAAKPELQKYAPVFLEKKVSGRLLPIIAMGKGKMLTKWGFTPEDAEKLSQAIILETLFPSPPSFKAKDVVLVVCLLLLPMAGFGLWATSKGSKELDTQLQQMKEKLEYATLQLEKETRNDKFSGADDGTTMSIHNSDDDLLSNTSIGGLTNQLPSGMNSPQRNVSHSALNEIERTDKLREQEAEILALKLKLQQLNEKTRQDMKHHQRTRHILRESYGREVKYWKDSARKAEEGLYEASSEYEKITKHQKRFMGTFRLAHGVSMEQLHESVQLALDRQRRSKQDKEDMLSRWESLDEMFHLGIGLHRRSGGAAVSVGSRVQIKETRVRSTSDAGKLPLSPLNELEENKDRMARNSTLLETSAPLKQINNANTMPAIGTGPASLVHHRATPSLPVNILEIKKDI